MGTYDDFARPEQGCTAPTATVNAPTAESISHLAHTPVSQDRQAGPSITDEQREAAITRAARAMEHHMANLRAINNRDPHIFSDFADAAAARWKAQRARELMEQLIAGRSPEQIARMERERGLDMPACANDARRA